MDTSLFSPSLIKGLTDKTYDRRKAAALDIERQVLINSLLSTKLKKKVYVNRLVREHEKSEETITQIVDALVQEFVYSNNPYARYGGLIGLAATSIALGQVNI